MHHIETDIKMVDQYTQLCGTEQKLKGYTIILHFLKASFHLSYLFEVRFP